ncbi:MAG TPA: TetR/AcrR family transcriptional regulator [Actinomycetes bacterium]|jgi:AcrR family transcriptional regulator|nr:TetR/AcrR family transcriptional regulator [Actinomycetes bacterium]
MPETPRERLLETATDLLYREGIQAVGINRIVAEAEVALMTLYRQFGDKDTLVAAALEHWSTQWLHWLAEHIDRDGGDPEARFAGLWDALEEWFTSEDFHGSFAASAAAELRGEPEHPAHQVIEAHRLAMRHLLEDLAKAAGAHDPVELATHLQVIIDGATSVAVVDRTSTPAHNARALASAALAAGAA